MSTHEWVTAYDVDGAYMQCHYCDGIANNAQEQAALDTAGCRR